MMTPKRLVRSGRFQYEESGQVLILTTLIMLGMLAMTALLIDVGIAYAQRRQMQNAADAAVTAAARVIAIEGSQCRDAEVKATVDKYVQMNNGSLDYVNNPPQYIAADGTPLGPVGAGGTIPAGTRGVSLTSETSFTTFFAAVTGHPIMDVAAPAACLAYQAQQPSRMGGMVPLTVPQSALDDDETVLIWGPQYVHHYDMAMPSNFKGILDLNDGYGPGYSQGAHCGNKKDCVIKWITFGFDGTLGTDNWLNIYGGNLGNNVSGPLLQKIYDQELRDPVTGEAYGFLILPVWDTWNNIPGDPHEGYMHICGFASFKVYASDVATSQASGYYCGFISPDSQISGETWTDVGPKVIKLVPPG